MSQPPRPKPTSPASSPPQRRLLTPQERFGTEPEAPPELSLVEDTAPLEEHASDESDPFAPYARPKLHTRQHAPRRHELKHHEVRPHELKRHEVKHLERERPEPTGNARRGPALENGVPVRGSEKRKRASRVVKSFLATAMILFIGFGVFAILSWPQFEVKTVRLEGVQATPQAKVEAIAHTLVGQNFFRADHASVERTVAALPSVASAHVAREVGWPPRLKLVVNERRPLLKVGAGTEWWVVDETGMPYRKASPEDHDLYALTARQFQPQLGKPLAAKWWNRALELQRALRSDNALASGDGEKAQIAQTEGTGRTNAPFWQLRRLYLDRHGMASIRVLGRGALRQHNEMLIRLGESDWAAKLSRARVALAYFERTGRNAQELDLVSYTYPTWRTKTDDSKTAASSLLGMNSGGKSGDRERNG